MSKRLVTVLMIFVLILAFTTQVVAQTNPPKFNIKVLALTAFGGETAPWKENETWPHEFTVSGAFAPVWCQDSGVCVTTVGEGKSNAAASVTAILLNNQFDFKDAYFIVGAIAGTRPDDSAEGFKGTLGFVGIAGTIVDGDFGVHFYPQDVGPGDPEEILKFSWMPLSDYESAVFTLNPELRQMAFDLTKDLTLSDSAEAQAARDLYPSQKGMLPFVALCDTVGADNFFSGTYAADQMDHIVRVRSKGEATKCTSEFEDPAIANALRLNGYLDRLIDFRSASDFETQPKDQTAPELVRSGFPGYVISTANVYLAASTVAHHLADG